MKSKELLAKSIAGEITLSDDSAIVMRKWREIFGVTQLELAKELRVSPSVISDYESGRRKSPGVSFVRRFIDALFRADRKKGGETIKKLMTKSEPDAILDIKEFSNPVSGLKIVKAVRGNVIANKKLTNRKLRGYTVINSIQAILKFSNEDFIKIYGSTTERALVFTKVQLGRSPMIAIKVTRPRPNMIILHGLKANEVDKLAVKIAKMENIPLVVSTLSTEDDLVERLEGIGK